jgi:mono/diheme cytochrome c family protein
MLALCARNLVMAIATFTFTAPVVAPQQQERPKEVANTSNQISGGQIFLSYCAPCHGKDAKGNGPAAAALTVSPPDLTTLSKRNKGKFPADYFASVLKNGVDVPAHGSAEMPIWGSTFADAKTHRIVTIRINDVVQYLESLQAK